MFDVTCTTRQRQSRWTALVRHVTLLSIFQYLPLHHTQHSPLSTLQIYGSLPSTLLLPAPSCHPARAQSPEPRAPVTDTRLSAYPSFYCHPLRLKGGRSTMQFHYSLSSSLVFPFLLLQTLFILLIFTSPGHIYHLQPLN